MQNDEDRHIAKKTHLSFEDELLGCAAPYTSEKNESVRSDEQKKRTRLTQALTVSVILNLALLFVCAYESQEMGYLILRKSAYKPIPEVFSQLHAKDVCELQEELVNYNQKSTDELLCLLKEDAFVADGYTKRDLALGLLCTKRHFNLAKALGKDAENLQVRTIVLKDEMGTIGEVRLFPGVSPEHYGFICRFVESERYPFTAEGLFLQLKENKTSGEINLSQSLDSTNIANELLDAENKTRYLGLLDAFSLTSQYLVIEPLFAKCEVTKQEIIECITTGSWKMVEDFAQEMQKAQNFTPEKRREVLFSYIGIGSEKAAELLVKLDRDFALHHLVDAQTCQVLLLLEKKPELTKDFALELLVSPRSDEVWKVAQVQLAKVTGQEAISGFTRGELLAHFGKTLLEDEKQKEQDSKALDKNNQAHAESQKNVAKKQNIDNKEAGAKKENKTPSKNEKSILSQSPQKPLLKEAGTKQGASKVKEVLTNNQVKQECSKQERSKQERSKQERPKPGVITQRKPVVVKKKQAKPEMLYVVQPGDNLWRIAKKFRVDVGVLRKLNNLKSDEVKPGLALRIPLANS